MLRSDRPLTAAVFAAAGVFGALTALPGPHWHDTAEFGAVARRLSISHPPGHPLHTLTTHAAQLLPLGDAGFRSNLASALALAVALALFFRLLRRLAPDGPPLAAAAAALLPAVMPAVWLQGARAEVYALQLILSVAGAHLCRRAAVGDDARAPAALAFGLGLGGANHSLIGLTWVPVGIAALVVARPKLRHLALGIPAGLLALGAYAYLPLRAHAGAEIGWGAPDTLARIWETISAQEWHRSIVPGKATVHVADNLADLAGYGIDQVGSIAAAVLLLVVLAGTPRLVAGRRWGAAAALAAVALAFFTPVVLYPMDLGNPDLGGYVAAGFLAGVALAWQASNVLGRRAAWAFVPLLALAAPRFDPGGRMGARAAESTARAMLDEVPAGGTIAYSDYSSWFLGSYLRSIEGWRPDVAIVFRGQIFRDWFRERLARHRPDVAARDFPAGFGGPDVRFEPGVAAEQLGDLEARLVPVGLTLAAGAAWPSTATLATAFAPLAAGTDIDSRRTLAFLHVEHAEHLLRLATPQAHPLLAWHVAQASALAPGDPLVDDLAARAAASAPAKSLDAAGGR